MWVEYLRDIDYRRAGEIAWEPACIARVLIDGGFARESAPPRRSTARAKSKRSRHDTPRG